MPFMVIYRNGDGSAGYEQADAIDEAALFVERLRNNESIDQIRLFRMDEINFAFRPYYKVELAMPDRLTRERDQRTADTSGGPTADGHPMPRTGDLGDDGSPLGLFQR